jgi:hypothetical protein
MKLRTTKKLAKLLNDKIKNYTIRHEKLSRIVFERNVDSYSFDHDVDYDYTTNTYNVFIVDYPPEYYAIPRYITTKDLRRIFNSNKCDGTLENFIQAFYNDIEI